MKRRFAPKRMRFSRRERIPPSTRGSLSGAIRRSSSSTWCRTRQADGLCHKQGSSTGGDLWSRYIGADADLVHRHRRSTEHFINDDGNSVTLFYRGRELRKPVKIPSGPDLEQIAARLGGDGPPGTPTFDFSYADVVAILQSMIDGRYVTGEYADGRQVAAFVLQELPKIGRGR